MAMQPYTHGDHGYQPPQHQQQFQGNVVPISNPRVHASSILSSPTLVAQFEKLSQETNQFINLQSDQLKQLLQHQLELQENTFRIMENQLRSLETEKRELKRIVEEREATIITLYNNLEEEKMKQMIVVANDVESCGENEEARSEQCLRHGNRIRLLCPNCITNSACLLFLPCWHLSSCKACETLVHACPICGKAKNGVVKIQSLILD